MFVTVSAGSVELGRTTFQLISEREVPQRESFQLVTQVWKLVCSSHLREEFLRSCWIELRNIYFSKLASHIKRNHLEAKRTGGQHVGGSSPKINPKECACLGGSCPLGAKLTRQTVGSDSATLPHTTKCCGSRSYRQSGWGRYRP